MPTGDIVILPAYPNPFSASTSIPFSTDNQARIFASVYDLMGRQVAFLQKDLYPGNHEVHLNLSNQAAGVYFLRLTDGASILGTAALIKAGPGSYPGPDAIVVSSRTPYAYSGAGKTTMRSLASWELEVTRPDYLPTRRPVPVPSDAPCVVRLCVGYTNMIGMPLVLIRAGTFDMGDLAGDGDPDEQPVHTETFTRDFYIGRYEVTQEEYVTMVGNNPSHNPENDRRPVENVSWYDAVRFVNALSTFEDDEPCYDNNGNVIGGGGNPYECEGYRLPMEAEWEYATRAGTTTKYYYGDTLTDLMVNTRVSVVGEKYQNPWGLYDVHGNVEEWVYDWYSAMYYENSPSIDPSGPVAAGGKVIRDGIPSSDRWTSARSIFWYGLGFRLVRTAK